MAVLQKNLRLICWYQAIQMSLLPIAIISLFWKHQLGLSMSEIMFLQAYFALCVGLFEFPSGYIADHIGYKKSLIIAALTGSLGWAVYSICVGFWQLMFASTILAVSLSLVSGAPEAIIYESLKDSKKESDIFEIKINILNGESEAAKPVLKTLSDNYLNQDTYSPDDWKIIYNLFRLNVDLGQIDTSQKYAKLFLKTVSERSNLEFPTILYKKLTAELILENCEAVKPLANKLEARGYLDGLDLDLNPCRSF